MSKVTGKIAMCRSCAGHVGVEKALVGSSQHHMSVVCVMCGEHRGADIAAVPVDADFSNWMPQRDGRWDSPPWYLNPRINAAISIIMSQEPTGQMKVWIESLDRWEIECKQ